MKTRRQTAFGKIFPNCVETAEAFTYRIKGKQEINVSKLLEKHAM